jgi:cytochrome c oxidase subunit I
MVAAFFVPDGPTLGGWTQYAPLSAVGAIGGPGQGTGRGSVGGISIGIFCIGQLLGSLNFITTTLDMRCKGMSP